MDVRILDLDGSVAEQDSLRARASTVVPLRDWGPRLRLACSWGSFGRFESDLSQRLEAAKDTGPKLTFVGSGDFHHVTLALLRRIEEPFNLLVIDNHPDWVRGVPFLHCGTWLNHAVRLPNVRHVYHAGGDSDFDNHYRWLAPWPHLRSGKIRVFPAIRQFQGALWRFVPQTTLRAVPSIPFTPMMLGVRLRHCRDELADLPLYVTLDRDVLRQEDAVVNWDSGHLGLAELLPLVETLSQFNPRLLGADVVGDWSPVHVKGALRRLLHWTEHPRVNTDARAAQALNEQVNLSLVKLLAGAKSAGYRQAT
jgi:hypothetical protein